MPGERTLRKFARSISDPSARPYRPPGRARSSTRSRAISPQPGARARSPTTPSRPGMARSIAGGPSCASCGRGLPLFPFRAGEASRHHQGAPSSPSASRRGRRTGAAGSAGGRCRDRTGLARCGPKGTRPGRAAGAAHRDAVPVGLVHRRIQIDHNQSRNGTPLQAVSSRPHAPSECV